MSKRPLIVITGASSGIGAATAQEFSRQGHPLLLLARRVERLEALKLPDTLCEKLDVSDLEGFGSVVQKAERRFGPTDCLVNNAGVMLLGQAHTQDPTKWRKMFEVNVLALLNGIRTVLAGMIERKHGTVVNVSSVAGRKTFPAHSVYCGTKFAVHAMTEGMREEVAPHNVRFVTIAPGAVETDCSATPRPTRSGQGLRGLEKEHRGRDQGRGRGACDRVRLRPAAERLHPRRGPAHHDHLAVETARAAAGPGRARRAGSWRPA